MHRSVLAVTILITLASARMAIGAPQAPVIERHTASPRQETGMALLAAGANIVYFPLRLALTTVTAAVGGLTGWLNGGNRESAQRVWESTDGPAYVTPEMLSAGHSRPSGM